MESYYTASHDQKTYLAYWKVTDSAQELKPRHCTSTIPHSCRRLSVVVRRPQEVIQGDWFSHVLQTGNVIIAAQSPDFCCVTFTDRHYATAFFNMWVGYDASVVLITVGAFERGRILCSRCRKCLTPLPGHFHEPPRTIDISGGQLRSDPNHPISRKAIATMQSWKRAPHDSAVAQKAPQRASQEVQGQGVGCEPPVMGRSLGGSIPRSPIQN